MKIAILAAAAVSLGVAAHAEPPCAETHLVYSSLAAKYGERPAFIGFDARGFISELWLNDETGSWTQLVSRSDGVSCVTGHGSDAFYVVPAPAGDPA
jgi:hypothetical protein